MSKYPEWDAMFIAAQVGNISIVEQLISQGVDVNAKFANGQTFLHIAAENGQTKVVKLLLDYEASINALDDDSRTALHLASQSLKSDETEVVSLLLDLELMLILRMLLGTLHFD
ncbi:hypothetical protein Unana1_03160 [Umbelopsis nana]